MPMQPRPSAETSRPRFPSLRFCIVPPSLPTVITRRAFLAGAGVAAAGSLIGWRVAQRSGDLTLDNGLVQGRWSVADGVLRAIDISDRASGQFLPLSADVCALVFRDGTTVGTTALRVTGDPRVSVLAGDPHAARLAARLPGHALDVELADAAGRVRVTCRAELRAGSRYVRQEVRLEAISGEVAITDVRLVDLDVAGAAVRGEVRGSPIVAGSWFIGFEHPLADVAVEGGRARACAPVPALSALQLVVRHRLLLQVRRSGRTRRDRRGRTRAARAPRRTPRFVSVRRRLGRSPHVVALSRRLPARFQAGA